MRGPSPLTAPYKRHISSPSGDCSQKKTRTSPDIQGTGRLKPLRSIQTFSNGGWETGYFSGAVSELKKLTCLLSFMRLCGESLSISGTVSRR